MCKWNDCGWCYAPKETDTNDQNGACNSPKSCPQNKGNLIILKQL